MLLSAVQICVVHIFSAMPIYPLQAHYEHTKSGFSTVYVVPTNVRFENW